MHCQVFALRLDLAEWRASARSEPNNDNLFAIAASIAYENVLVDQHTADSSATRSDFRVPPAVFWLHDTGIS